MRYKFTDTEIKKIENSIVILCDTREKESTHILSYFEKHNIPYQIQKLDYGDYSFKVPLGVFKGQQREIYFDREYVIERKASIDELVGNFADQGARIKKELAHMNKYRIRCDLLVENPNFELDILRENYRSQYKGESLYNRIYKTIQAEYGVPIFPQQKSMMGFKIEKLCKSYVYAKFKHEGWIEEEIEDEGLSK